MDIRPIRSALMGLLVSLAGFACAFAAPTISSFNPMSGTIGNQVVINGSGFTGATAVMFHGIKATTYTVNSDTKITATVPISASTGLLKVTAGGSTAASATNFTVTPGVALSIAVGAPSSKPTVYGVGFHPMDAVDIFFDNYPVGLFVTTASGTLSTTYKIPLSAQPGQHWITLVERGTNWAAQKAFTVRTNWAQEGFGPANYGTNPFENTIDTNNVGTLRTKWSGDAGGSDVPSPFVVAGGSVFVADANGNIHAYSADTGALLWTASPGTSMQRVNPVAAMGRVFFGDGNGDVRSYSQTCRSDGGVCTPQWTTNIMTAVTAGLTFFKGTLYVPSADGTIHTLDPTTGVAGAPIYINKNDGAITTPISFGADGSFSYGAGVYLQFSFAPVPGETAYSGLLSPIVVHNGSAYFTSAGGYLSRQGSGFWNVPTSGTGCFPAPVVALNRVYAGGCSSLAAYNLETGDVLWSVDTGQILGIAEANSVLYACEVGPHNLISQAYDAIYGTYLWSGGGCRSGPEIADGKVFGARYNIYAYDLATNVGSVAAPTISSLRPDYGLKPQLSGTPVMSNKN